MNSDANPAPAADNTHTRDSSPTSAAPRPKQRITARALLETKRLSDPQIHPDGQRIAFVATEANFDESHWVSHLWLTEYAPTEEEDLHHKDTETQRFHREDEEKGRGGEGERRKEKGESDAQTSVEHSSVEHSSIENRKSKIENPDDLTRQLTFSREGETQPRWSPDGRYLAFLSARPDETQTLPDEDEDDATDQVWILPIDGGEARKVTSAREGVLDYEWVPDSNSIAYLASEPRPRPLESLRKEERNRRRVDPIVEQDDRLRRQLWRVDVDEEKPKLLFTGDYGISDFAVSPDGERLAFVTNYSGEGNDYHLADLYIRYLNANKTVKLVARAGGKYHLRWSPDGAYLAFLSWLDPLLSYSRECVFVADVPRELPDHAPTEYGSAAPGLTECRLLTDLDYDLGSFEWAQPVEDASIDDSGEANSEIGETEAPDTETDTSPVTTSETAPAVLGYALAAVRTGALLVQIAPGDTQQPHAVTLYDDLPSTHDEALTINEAVTPETPEDATPPHAPDRIEMSQPIIHNPQSTIHNRASIENRKSKIENPKAERSDLTLDPGGRSLAYVQESANALPEIFLRDEYGQVHQLTQLNAEFSRSYELPHQEVVTWTSPDGLEIEGVLTLPTQGERKQEKGESDETQSKIENQKSKIPSTPLPLIVQIHGGPKGRSTHTLQNYSMAPVWAVEGYAVLRPNYRGSEGYGNPFAIANRRDLGGGDFADIMAGVDWCIAQGIADPERLGVMGGSYGGYMTNWAIGHTDRFKGAVSMFGIFHLQTDYSNSELSRWENDYAGAYYWEDPEIYRRMSPGTYLDAIKTPTLILHGDDDSNTFISNSKEMYQALRHRGVTTQFVHYPREGHGVREPNHKLDEIRRCLVWMDKYVRHGGQNPPMYRIGDRVPGANGLLELCVTRADLPTFLGQPKPEKDAPNPTQLLEVVFTLSNKDTREHVPPLLLPLATIQLEENPEQKTEDRKQKTEAGEPITSHPIGVALDVLGGKTLIEGEHLRVSQHPDANTGQLAFGCAIVYRVPKMQTAGLLHVPDFPPVQIQWAVEEDKDELDHKSEE